MTLREGGILVSRGLAIYFLGQSLAFLLSALTYIPGIWGNYGWRTPGLYLSQALLEFVFAGFLWRGAGSFTSDVPSSSGGRPIGQGGLLRVVVAGIAVFWLFTETNLILNQVVTYFQGGWKSEYMAGLIRDLVMIGVAIGTVCWAARGMTLSRMISYPRAEPYDKAEKESEPPGG